MRVWVSLRDLGLMPTVVYSSILRPDVCGSAVLRDFIGAFDCRISSRELLFDLDVILRSRTVWKIGSGTSFMENLSEI